MILNAPLSMVKALTRGYAKLLREKKSAAKKLEFEKAAEFRNRIKKLQELEIKYAEGVA